MHQTSLPSSVSFALLLFSASTTFGLVAGAQDNAPSDSQRLLHDMRKRPVRTEPGAGSSKDETLQEQQDAPFAGASIFAFTRLWLNKPFGDMGTFSEHGETVVGGSVDRYFAHETDAELGVGVRISGPWSLVVLGGVGRVSPGTSSSAGLTALGETSGIDRMVLEPGTSWYGALGVMLRPCDGCSGWLAEVSFGLTRTNGSASALDANGARLARVRMNWEGLTGRMVAGWGIALAEQWTIAPVVMVETKAMTAVHMRPLAQANGREVDAQHDGTAGYRALSIGVQGWFSLGLGR